MVEKFGGPCCDDSDDTWKKSLPVEVDGSIEVRGSREYAQVRHLAPKREQAQAAANYVGQVANQVTGRLFITVLTESFDNHGKVTLEETDGATMSGFWLDQTKFVTCAHFLEGIGTKADETEKFLKATDPPRPRAFVSNKKFAAPGLTPHCSNSWPVHLLRLSRSSDIAIFELHPAAAKKPNHLLHSIRSSEVSATITAPGMSSKESVSYLHLFAAYYPGHNPRVADSDLSPVRKQFAKDANITDMWTLFATESLAVNPGATAGSGISQQF